ncbi:hypothetical protein JW859_01295 [bacterium]|nr:hypothetical protein [bacterium]
MASSSVVLGNTEAFKPYIPDNEFELKPVIYSEDKSCWLSFVCRYKTDPSHNVWVFNSTDKSYATVDRLVNNIYIVSVKLLSTNSSDTLLSELRTKTVGGLNKNMVHRGFVIILNEKLDPRNLLAPKSGIQVRLDTIELTLLGKPDPFGTLHPINIKTDPYKFTTAPREKELPPSPDPIGTWDWTVHWVPVDDNYEESPHCGVTSVTGSGSTSYSAGTLGKYLANTSSNPAISDNPCTCSDDTEGEYIREEIEWSRQ